MIECIEIELVDLMNNKNVLRQRGSIAVYITHVVDAGYYSILVASPHNTAFLWMPNRHMNYANSFYFCCKNRIGWQSKFDESASMERKFNKYLSSQGFKRRQVPYGMIAHFFKNMGNENIWNGIMWEGWYRVYAVPDRQAVDKFIFALESWLEKSDSFGLRFVSDEDVINDMKGDVNRCDYWTYPLTVSVDEADYVTQFLRDNENKKINICNTQEKIFYPSFEIGDAHLYGGDGIIPWKINLRNELTRMKAKIIDKIDLPIFFWHMKGWLMDVSITKEWGRVKKMNSNGLREDVFLDIRNIMTNFVHRMEGKYPDLVKPFGEFDKCYPSVC